MFHVHSDYVDTTGPTFQTTRTSGGLTVSWGDPKTTRATVSPTFHTTLAIGYENSRINAVVDFVESSSELPI